MNFDDLSQFLAVNKSRSALTISQDIAAFKRFLNWCDENKLPLTPLAVEKFLYSLKMRGLKNSTLNVHIKVFKIVQDYYNSRSIPITIYKDLKTLRLQKQDVEILTSDEIERICAVTIAYSRGRAAKHANRLNQTYQTLIKFLALTGCRKDEALSLKPNDVFYDQQYVLFRDTKNDTDRRVWVTVDLLDDLKKVKGPTYVFDSTNGRKIHHNELLRQLKLRAKKAGVTKRVYNHLFRHTFITTLLSQGVDVTVVAKIVGHKDVQSTYGYTHYAEETLKKAMYTHPLIRRRIDTREKFMLIVQSIKNLHLEQDKDLVYRLDEGSSSIRVDIYKK